MNEWTVFAPWARGATCGVMVMVQHVDGNAKPATEACGQRAVAKSGWLERGDGSPPPGGRLRWGGGVGLRLGGGLMSVTAGYGPCALGGRRWREGVVHAERSMVVV